MTIKVLIKRNTAFIVIPIILFLSIPLSSVSQDIDISFKSVYGYYWMFSLKNFQKDIKTDVKDIFGVDATITDNFPNNWGFEVEAIKKFDDKLGVGLTFNYATTGGAVAYADYSGSLSYVSKLQMYHLSNTYRRPLIRHEIIHINFLMAIGLALTNYDIKSEFDLTSGNYFARDHQEKYTALNLTFSPGFESKIYIIQQFIYLNIAGGLELHVFNEPIRIHKYADLMLKDNIGEYLDSNWSGYRVKLGLGMTLNRQGKK